MGSTFGPAGPNRDSTRAQLSGSSSGVQRETVPTVLFDRLERRRFEAIVQGDWDLFEELCAADMRYVHASGAVDSRNSYMKKLRNGHYDYHHIDHITEGVFPTSTPDLLIGWGTMRATLRAGDREISIDSRTIVAWTRSRADWLLLTHQSTAR